MDANSFDPSDARTVTLSYKGREIVMTPYHNDGRWDCSYYIVERGNPHSKAHPPRYIQCSSMVPNDAKAIALTAAQLYIDSLDPIEKE